MSTILLSIKPQYVKEILKGKKRYEFRKNKPKRSVTRMVIYASWPQQQVVGEAIIDEILEGQPDEIWDITKEFAGVDKRFFSSYYAGRNLQRRSWSRHQLQHRQNPQVTKDVTT